MKHIKLFESFMKSSEISEVDYTGEYSSLYDFIYDNDIQKYFCTKYDIPLIEWDDNVRGELGEDEEIIEELIGKDYKVFYDEDTDYFIITKKNNKKNVSYSIKKSTNNKVIDIIDLCGIFTEYDVRFEITSNDDIIGGSTYHIEEGEYIFDIGILEEYQGLGIAKKLIDLIIKDAKKLNCGIIKAQVVNMMLLEYLRSINFSISKDSGIYYAWKNL